MKYVWIFALWMGCVGAAVANEANGSKPDLEQWQAMRFGMFIHWGPVSMTGHEIGWSRGRETPIETYDALHKTFDPQNFDPAEWVRVAKAAGMKYIILTTKHHDGFCLWDTKQTDFNIMNSPLGRDVVGELSAACRKQGIAFGTYYSTCDWHHPDFPLTSPGGRVKRETYDLERYTEYLRAQVTELITQYGPLSTLWFDVPQRFDAERGQSVIDLCRRLQPNIVINNRSGAKGDYDTPEQRVGGFNIERPWETCMTICNQWAWKPDDAMKSLQQCLQTLVRTAGGDGNLLFNVGPTPDGEIEPRQIERLAEMGAWLNTYGISIYDTRGGPFKPGQWGASTRRDNTIYLHVFTWPADGLQLPAISHTIRGAAQLGGGPVAFTQSDEGVTINLPAEQRQEIDTVIALTLDGPAMAIEPLSVGVSSQAKASNVYHGDDQYAADRAVDGDPDTRWATDTGTKTAWLEIAFRKPLPISGVTIDEWAGGGKRIQSFTLQYQKGEDWETIHSGTTIGSDWQLPFDPVTTGNMRLQILDATDGPTINEISFDKTQP